jgi:hypothetical protein
LIILSFFFNINLNISTSRSAVGTINYGSPIIATSSSIVFVPFISGVDLSKATSDNTFDVGIQVSGTSTSISFYIISSSSTPTFVKSLNVNLIIYNADYYNRNQYASFYFGQLSGTAGANPIKYSNTSNVYEPNVMVGLSGFSFNQASATQFSIGFNSPNELLLSSTLSSNVLKANFIVMKTFFCDVMASTYDQATNSCILSCSVRTYQDSTHSTCLACLYDCYTCNSQSGCLSCNSTSDHRVLSSNRCIPEQGYF